MKRVTYRALHGVTAVDVPDVELSFVDGETKEVHDRDAARILTNRNFVDADTDNNPNYVCANCDADAIERYFLDPRTGETRFYREDDSDQTTPPLCRLCYLAVHGEYVKHFRSLGMTDSDLRLVLARRRKLPRDRSRFARKKTPQPSLTAEERRELWRAEAETSVEELLLEKGTPHHYRALKGRENFAKSRRAGVDGLAYFDLLRDVAKRYFDVWPEQRDAILDAHKRDGKRLLTAFGFATADDLAHWFASTYDGETIGAGNDTLRSRRVETSTLSDEEQSSPWGFLRGWLTAERGEHGGLFGLNLAYATVSIATPQEVLALQSASDEDLRNIPPVPIVDVPRRGLPQYRKLSAFSIDEYAAVVPNERRGGFGFEEMPQDVGALFVSLFERLNAVAGDPVSVGLEGPDVRTAYHTFASTFWKWYETRDTSAIKRERHVSPIPQGDFLIPSASVMQATHRTIVSRETWKVPLDDYPFRDDEQTALRFSIGGETGDGTFDPKTDGGFSADLASLDPQWSIIYAAAMGAWTAAYHQNKLTASGGVAIHVNDILELRGLKRKGASRDFKPEQKRIVADTMRRLGKLRLRGTHMRPDGKNIRLSGPLIEIVEAEVEDLFGFTPYGFVVRPGMTVQPLFVQSPQLATYFAKLAKLDTRQGVERMAYLIGLYLAFQYRTRKKTQNFDQPFSVRTLLDGSRVPVEGNSKHFTRFRDQFDKALDRLAKDGITAGWQYVAGDEERLPVRGWFRPWLEQCRVCVTPPATIVIEAAEQAKRLTGDSLKKTSIPT